MNKYGAKSTHWVDKNAQVGKEGGGHAQKSYHFGRVIRGGLQGEMGEQWITGMLGWKKLVVAGGGWSEGREGIRRLKLQKTREVRGTEKPKVHYLSEKKKNTTCSKDKEMVLVRVRKGKTGAFRDWDKQKTKKGKNAGNKASYGGKMPGKLSPLRPWGGATPSKGKQSCFLWLDDARS